VARASFLRLAGVLAVGCALVTPDARADEPTAAPGMLATSTQLHVAPFGEPTGDRALDPSIAMLPLRLSLLGDTFPIGRALGDSPCQTSEDATGNTRFGFPVMRQTYLALSPRLVLHGFSRGGCPIDAGIGGGATYSIPLPNDMWLVASAGVYSQANQASATPGRSLLRSDARLDVVLRKTDSSSLAIGLGRRGVALTGLW
jgi:hypothetical protein